jgi:HD-GYP domain-containing protein (c-di-GMP phosphodiesterase class II)
MDIDSYESPETQALLQAAQTRRSRQGAIGHEVLTHGVAALGFVLAAGVLALLGHRAIPLSLPTLGLTVALFALAASLRFPVGGVWANPTQLVFVPMLFVLPAPIVPLAVAVGMLLARLPELGRRQLTAPRLVAVLGDCWYALGPAVVLVAAGSPAFAWSDWPLYLGAFAAQVAFDSASTVSRCWFAERIKPRDQLPPMAWTFAVDLALSTVGLMIAAVSSAVPTPVARPGLVLLALPLIGLLGLFARERHERLDQVLTLSSAYRGTALLLADVVEADDFYTGEHSRGVLELSLEVADELGIDPTHRRVVEFASLLHDVGKIRVPKTIITKRGPLDDDEWTIIRRHTIDGEAMLCQVGGALVEVGRIVRASHERYDGQGYPDGLTGEEIPLEARIVTACDSYSAMTTDRPYRPARAPADALAELERCAGSQFDPRVVATLRELLIRRTSRRPATAGGHDVVTPGHGP